MQPVIRDARASDRDTLREVYLLSRVDTFRWLDTSRFALDDFDAAVSGERILVAERGGRVVGFASVWEADDYLHNLFVHPAHLGTGVGHALLAAAEARSRGPMTLKCLVRNERALRFYAAHGWREVARGATDDGEHVILSSGGRPAAGPVTAPAGTGDPAP